MDNLKAIEAGLCKVNMLVSGALDDGLAVQGNGDPPGSDVVEAAENVEETQGAQNPCKFAPAQGLILQQSCGQIAADRLVGWRGPGGVGCHNIAHHMFKKPSVVKHQIVKRRVMMNVCDNLFDSI